MSLTAGKNSGKTINTSKIAQIITQINKRQTSFIQRIKMSIHTAIKSLRRSVIAVILLIIETVVPY